MTLLFYVDESREANIHIHAGVLVSGQEVSETERLLKGVVTTAARAGVCDSVDSELHGYEVFNGCGEWSDARPSDCVKIFDDVLSSLNGAVEVISRGIDISAFTRMYGKNPHASAFSNLLERLNFRLDERDEFGLVVADRHDEFADLMRDNLAEARRQGTPGYVSSKLDRVLDTVHFVDSRRSRLTQLADMVTFILRRRECHPTENDARLEDAMRRWDGLVEAAVPEFVTRYRTVWRA